MTIRELLDVVDYNRESTLEQIEICRPDADWEDCDRVLTSSALLIPFYDVQIKSLEAVAEDVIRVDIDWNEVIKK